MDVEEDDATPPAGSDGAEAAAEVLALEDGIALADAAAPEPAAGPLDDTTDGAAEAADEGPSAGVAGPHAASTVHEASAAIDTSHARERLPDVARSPMRARARAQAGRGIDTGRVTDSGSGTGTGTDTGVDTDTSVGTGPWHPSTSADAGGRSIASEYAARRATAMATLPQRDTVNPGQSQSFTLVFAPLDPGVTTFSVFEGEDAKNPALREKGQLWAFQQVELKGQAFAR